MKNAYVVVTDTHIINRMLTQSRENYAMELDCVKKRLVELIREFKESGHSVRLLFLGDIFHRGYVDPIAATTDNNFLVLLSSMTDGMYTVIGNHELSYVKNNPFYTLLKRIESKKINKLKTRAADPKGVLQIMEVVDELEDGEVKFSFNHYGCGIAAPEEGRVNIGLFHQDLICKEILEDVERRFGHDVWSSGTRGLEVFQGYQYCFLGHMHQAYGIYAAGEGKNQVVLYYLASLGRTNHGEVRNDFLERNLPVVVVEDGKFCKIVDNFFNLPRREECIKEVKVKETQEVYKKQKFNREVRNYVASSDDPVLRVAEQLSSERGLLGLFNELRKGEIAAGVLTLEDSTRKLKRDLD